LSLKKDAASIHKKSITPGAAILCKDIQLSAQLKKAAEKLNNPQGDF